MAEAAFFYQSGRVDEADREGLGEYLHGTEGSLTSEDEDEEEDIGLQAALAASMSEIGQEELELQRAIEASRDTNQDVKFTLDTERAIEISLHQERTLEEMRKFQEELEAASSDRRSFPASSSVSIEGTASRGRHHPFLSPPASVILGTDETGPSGFSPLGATGGSDSGSTATEVDLSGYPILPDYSSTSSSMHPDDDFGDSISTGPSSPPPTHLPSRVRPDAFQPEDSTPFPIGENPQYEWDHLPPGAQRIPITVLGGTEPVDVPVQVESSAERREALRSPSPILDVPFPEVVHRKKNTPTPRGHERAFATRSAHMTYVPSSSSSVQEEREDPSDSGSDYSLFRRLAVPPTFVVPPKIPTPSVMTPRPSLAVDPLADVDPQMSLQLFRTTTRPLFSDQCLCVNCGAIFVHDVQSNPPNSQWCLCESCGMEFCHGCRSVCENPNSCQPWIATAIFRLLSLLDVELLRLGGPERVSELLETKRREVAHYLSMIVAYLNGSLHMEHLYLPHLVNLSLLPVIFEYLLGRPPKLWIETQATEEVYSQMLAFLALSLHVGEGEILFQRRGRIEGHKGLWGMMQDSGGITWVPTDRSFADVIEGICMGNFMKEAEDYISRCRYLFYHLNEHVDRVRHLFEGIERWRMMDDSGQTVTSRRSNYDVVV